MIQRCASRSITALFLFSICSLANAMDNLYIFVFKNGEALENIMVKVGDHKKNTDIYGLANFDLPAGDYDIGYYKNEKLFALTDIHLLPDQQSQVFLTLTQDGEQVELDLPLDAYRKDFEQKQMKQQSGPKGTLQLKLVDSKTKQPVAGAKLFFKGYSVEGKTELNGSVSVPLSVERYDISIIHPKYIMKVLKNIKITANKTNTLNIELVRADIVLDEYVVSAPSVEGSLASTFNALKESSVIGEALSNEEFSKSGDASAADALKRVTGITIVNGKYVYVRGLGERYSVVMLNNLYVPSPEPTKRVVPLDIFPSGVIQSINIQKTYSSDLPGTFAGGDVLIESKDIPKEDNYIKFSLSPSYNNATGSEVYTNSDNNKGIPGDIIAKSANFQPIQQSYGGPGYTQEEMFAINSAIVNYRSYNKQRTTLKPGYKIAFDVGQSFKSSHGTKYGIAGTAYYGESANNKKATKYSTAFVDNTLGILERSEYQTTKLESKLGGLVSLGVERKGRKLKYTFLKLFDKQSTTTFSEKDGGQLGPSYGDQERTYYEYKEKTITTHQLQGDIHLNLGAKSAFLNAIDISLSAEKATATRLEPGSVEYVYERDSSQSPFALDENIWYLYSNLKDEVNNFRLDISLPYQVNSHKNYSSFGLFAYFKNRTLDNRRFLEQHYLGNQVYDEIDSVLTQDNVDLDYTYLSFSSNYRPADAYTAKQDVLAFYVKQLYSITRDIDILAGIRSEKSKQQLIDTETAIPYDPLNTNDLLSSVSLNYSFNSNHKLRFGFANTLSRPDFREFSPNRYKDPVTEDIVFGYPGLTYTKIKNLDIKYEWYISYDEMFYTGLFSKDFTNPVETIVRPDPNSQTGKNIVSYRNALGGTAKGVEIGLRKKLKFLGDTFSNYFTATNLAYITSRIRLDDNSDDSFIQRLTSKDRPMQGQSPYVINFNIGYDNLNTGRSAILLYNEFGKRISALGSYGSPDYYEYPFKKLDFVVKWRLNDTYDEQIKKIGFNLDFKFSNLLDSNVEIHQGDEIVESYKPGRSLSLSFSMKY